MPTNGSDQGCDYSPDVRRTPPPSPMYTALADPIDDIESFICVFKSRVDKVNRHAHASYSSTRSSSAPVCQEPLCEC
jgi:hypothetical protein